MDRIIVVDTNVLLNDPYAFYAYDDSEIVVPQTILSELDKLKLGRVDQEVRYRGREVSRTLFELSQYGSLLTGIELDNGSVIRVAQHDPNNFPASLNVKNGDDRILGTAWRLQKENPSTPVILLTNDLNMLLKAQALGIEVQRHENEYRRSFWGRLFSGWRKRRFSMAWALVPIILLGIFAALWLFVPSPINTTSSSNLGATSFSLREAQLLESIEKNESSFSDWYQLGQLYLDWGDKLQSDSDLDDAREKRRAAVNAFNRTLSIRPDHVGAMTSLGTAYYYLGNTDEAIEQYNQVLRDHPDYALAHFNLGYILFNQGDYEGAGSSFRSYLDLKPNGEHADKVRQLLQEIETLKKKQT